MLDKVINLFDDLPIIEYKGKYYWNSKDEVLPELEPTLEKVESNVVPSFRRVVGTGTNGSDIYAASGDPKDYVNAAYIPKEDGYLADRRDKRVYKRITSASIEDYNKYSFLVFENDTKSMYCIRNDCNSCPFRDKCVSEIEEVELKDNQSMIIASLDISAQEPTQVVLLSKETAYYSTFRNRTIRELKLNIYVDKVVGDYFHFDPDKYSAKAEAYWRWLSKFHWEWGKLIDYNDLVEKYKQDPDKYRDKLKRKTKGILDEVEVEIKRFISDKKH